jgi:hypothetical protein
MPSWSLTASDTIDRAQRLIDVSGVCSGASPDPQKASYALSAALANEVKARALRAQSSDFTFPTQTAYVMFQFVTNDKQASAKDRHDASLHLAQMADLLKQSGIK